jgi:hypothetical protein
MARQFHERYCATAPLELPDNRQPWEKLTDTYLKANREQAQYAIQILKAVGLAVRQAKTPVLIDSKIYERYVEPMAEMEHGRWNVERLQEGQRFGKQRDKGRKIHDCLVPWGELPERTKDFDRVAVRAFPEILKLAGWEVYKP